MVSLSLEGKRESSLLLCLESTMGNASHWLHRGHTNLPGWWRSLVVGLDIMLGEDDS
jgi:hypothetical protein